jgi:nucleoside-diphosphate-sugar epimerase
VLVTGASGYVGRHVAASLLRCGAKVRALVRDASTMPPELEGAAEAAVGNLVDPDSLRSAMKSVDLVVHCAAVTTNSVPWWVHEQTNVEGTRAVRDAAREAGVRRLVHVSSVAVYGADSRSPVPESAPLPRNVNRWAYYQRSKIAAEQLVTNGAAGGLEVVVVRPGIIYGPGRLPVPGEVQLGATRVMIGSGKNNLPYVYIDDVVDGILLALTVPGAAGEVYNLADAPDLDAKSLAERTAEILGETLRVLPLPVAPLTMLARALERRREEAGAEIPPQLSQFQIEQRVRDLRYDVSKARTELGWTPAVTLDEGLRRALSPPPD